MMKSNNDQRTFNIWLIVPLLKSQEHEIAEFIKKHHFLLKKNISVLFKVCDPAQQFLTDELKYNNIAILRKQDTSLYEAWNQAIDHLKKELTDNDYVVFLGMDDQWSEDFLDKAINLIANNDSTMDFIFGNSLHIFDNKTIKRTSPINPRLFQKNYFSFDVPHPGMLNKWKTISGSKFNNELKLAADLDFYIEISLNNNITYRYLNCIQATLGAEGISNGPKSKELYLKEWKIIESKRNVSLYSNTYRTMILSVIAKFPTLFFLLRKLWWATHRNKIKTK